MVHLGLPLRVLLHLLLTSCNRPLFDLCLPFPLAGFDVPRLRPSDRLEPLLSLAHVLNGCLSRGMVSAPLLLDRALDGLPLPQNLPCRFDGVLLLLIVLVVRLTAQFIAFSAVIVLVVLLGVLILVLGQDVEPRARSAVCAGRRTAAFFPLRPFATTPSVFGPTCS